MPRTAAPDSTRGLTVKIATAMAGIDSRQWDRCANPPAAACLTGPLPADTSDEPDNPFLSHAFLNALETSGCATGRTGWKPVHVLVEDGEGALAACAPCYSSHGRWANMSSLCLGCL
jgi:predicted N-acyltransferase